MDLNTFIGFEECISSMGTHVLEKDRLSKALKGHRSDGGGR